MIRYYPTSNWRLTIYVARQGFIIMHKFNLSPGYKTTLSPSPCLSHLKYICMRLHSENFSIRQYVIPYTQHMFLCRTRWLNHKPKAFIAPNDHLIIAQPMMKTKCNAALWAHQKCNPNRDSGGGGKKIIIKRRKTFTIIVQWHKFVKTLPQKKTTLIAARSLARARALKADIIRCEIIIIN